MGKGHQVNLNKQFRIRLENNLGDQTFILKDASDINELIEQMTIQEKKTWTNIYETKFVEVTSRENFENPNRSFLDRM